jgi:hypothetical protein
MHDFTIRLKCCIFHLYQMNLSNQHFCSRLRLLREECLKHSITYRNIMHINVANVNYYNATDIIFLGLFRLWLDHKATNYLVEALE